MDTLNQTVTPLDPLSYFEQMFDASDDPWQFKGRWYEHRKRALTLAMLPQPRYRRAFEPGCANGELSAALAARCDELLACDLSPAAVRLAQARLAALPHVRVEQRALPEQWPAGQFDLIAISELAYYLDTAQLERLLRLALAALTDDATLLACHWRHPIDGWPGCGATVHAALDALPGLVKLAHYEDEDMLLDVWTRDGRSVAAREGLL